MNRDMPLFTQVEFRAGLNHDQPLIEQLQFRPVPFVADSRLPQDPTPEQIRERCLEIQETWDEATEIERRLGERGREKTIVEIPTIAHPHGHRQSLLEDACSPLHFANDGTPGICINGKGEEARTAKLTNAKVFEIRESDESSESLAERMGVAVSTVQRVRDREVWRHI